MLTNEPTTPSYEKVVNDILMDLKITNHMMKGKHVEPSVLVLSSILQEADLDSIMRKCMVQMFYAILCYTPFNEAWAHDTQNPHLMMDSFRKLRTKSVKNFLAVIMAAIPTDIYCLEALKTVVTRHRLILVNYYRARWL